MPEEPEEPDVPEKAEDKTETKETDKGLIVIDDGYINSQPEAERQILKSIKGEQLTPKALKNYVNAQVHIQRNRVQQEPKPDEHETNVEDIRAKLIHQQLKQRFSGKFEIPDVSSYSYSI